MCEDDALVVFEGLSVALNLDVAIFTRLEELASVQLARRVRRLREVCEQSGRKVLSRDSAECRDEKS